MIEVRQCEHERDESQPFWSTGLSFIWLCKHCGESVSRMDPAVEDMQEALRASRGENARRVDENLRQVERNLKIAAVLMAFALAFALVFLLIKVVLL